MKTQRALRVEENDSSSRVRQIRRATGVVDERRSKRQAFLSSPVVRARAAVREGLRRTGFGTDIYDCVPALLRLWVTP